MYLDFAKYFTISFLSYAFAVILSYTSHPAVGHVTFLGSIGATVIVFYICSKVSKE